MSILLIGVNHRTAPVEVREQLAFTREGVTTALLLFRNQFPKSEAAIISTCNRVEMLVASDDATPSINDVVSFIAQARDLPVTTFKPCTYTLSGEQAVRHLFRVASGLDSMVIGESQIVSQLKQAYAAASEQGTTGRVLNRLFHQAFEVGKRIRSETTIGAGKLSVSSVAVDVARTIFEEFSNKQTLVVGAGEMAQLVCQYLRDANAKKFVVATRTFTNGKALADACGGVAVPYDQLDEQLAHADIVITATACPVPIITPQRVRAAQQRRHGRLLFFIDLAVPRNVDPEVSKLEQVYVYDVDALGRIVAKNQEQRTHQVESCEQILDEEVSLFEQWLDSIKLNPLIEQMFQDAHDMTSAELQRLYRRKAVALLVERLVGKFMHPCVSALRRSSAPSAFLADELHAAAVKSRANG
jgi:glutamyl-tRNA reductase